MKWKLKLKQDTFFAFLPRYCEKCLTGYWLEPISKGGLYLKDRCPDSKCNGDLWMIKDYAIKWHNRLHKE